MTRKDKIEKRKKRSVARAKKNGERNNGRTPTSEQYISGRDCPYSVELYGVHGTCNCGGEREYECSQDI